MNAEHTFRVETERLTIRELDAVADAEFVFALLNTPKFLQYIGDRAVRSVEGARDFIEFRYCQSYRDHGFGLYAVEQLSDGAKIGLCGFVRRDTLPAVDLGFAFLPEYERQGYGFESAAAVMKYGREAFGFETVLAITSLDNDASGSLLEKLGFSFDHIIDSGSEQLKLYSLHYPQE